MGHVRAAIGDGATALGAGDCERAGDGLLVQPVNTLSSLAYLVAAGWLAHRALTLDGPERRATLAAALGVAGIGVGSVAYHGPQWPGSGWLHDLSIEAALLVALAVGLGQLRDAPAALLGYLAPAVATAGIVLAAVPASGVPTAATLAAAVVAIELAVRRRRRWFRPAAVVTAAGFVVGGLAQILGRTGGPLCDPDALLQGHAIWHVATAVALAAWAAGWADTRRSPSTSP